MTSPLASSYDHPPYSTDACIKCNVCNTVCPVARVTDLFPGPKYVGPQAERFRGGNEPDRSPDHTVDWCSGCGICTRACPAQVLIAETNNRARAAIVADRGTSLRNRIISDTDLLARLGVPFAPIANLPLRLRPVRWLLERILKVHRSAPIHPFTRRTFQARWRRSHARRPAAAAAPDPARSVVYFHGCAANAWEPEVAEAAVEVLERNGLAVIVPEQVCCGLPFISNGLYDHARRKARRNISALADYARSGYRIVGTSTSCTHTLKAEYRKMLDLDDADARAVADATWDICELLVEMDERGELNRDLGRIDEPLPYHPPCQLKSHGIGIPALNLFSLVPGLRAVDYDHDCCGAAGTYGLKNEKWQIAYDVGRPLFEKIGASGARRAACDSETCRWQIETASGVPTLHPVQILAESYRRYGAEPRSPT